MTGWNIHHLKMYFLLNMGFSIAMLLFGGVYENILKTSGPLETFIMRDSTQGVIDETNSKSMQWSHANTTHVHRLNFQNNTSSDWTQYPYVSTHSKKTFMGFLRWPSTERSAAGLLLHSRDKSGIVSKTRNHGHNLKGINFPSG